MTSSEPDQGPIVWRLHLRSSPEDVYQAIDTEEGRSRFWAESAIEKDGAISFEFINGIRHVATILEREPGRQWCIDYFSSNALFVFESDGNKGTDLTLVNSGVHQEDWTEVSAGWLNVLLPLKAWVDHRVDLRNHDPSRTWNQGYVDQ